EDLLEDPTVTELLRTLALSETTASLVPGAFHPRRDFGYRSYKIFREERAKTRSEEHTSELQSRENLVCRLLLEKKKTEEQVAGPTKDNVQPMKVAHTGRGHAHTAV